MTTCSCGCVQTPQSILDDEEVDVFATIIPTTEYDYAIKRAILWNFYGDRGIGHTDLTYWLRCMQRRYNLIAKTYDIKFRAWDAMVAVIEDANQGVDFSDYSKTVTSDGWTKDDSETNATNQLEDTPDTVASTTKYLSERTTDNSTVDAEGSFHTATTESGSTGKQTEDLKVYVDAVPRLYDDFADEFRQLFFFGA